MFDTIAPRYDRFTRVFSFGMDRRWKAELIGWIQSTIGAESRVLDLACGTGDLAFAAAKRAVLGSVKGVDASPKHVRHPPKKLERCTWAVQSCNDAFWIEVSDPVKQLLVEQQISNV